MCQKIAPKRQLGFIAPGSLSDGGHYESAALGLSQARNSLWIIGLCTQHHRSHPYQPGVVGIGGRKQNKRKFLVRQDFLRHPLWRR